MILLLAAAAAAAYRYSHPFVQPLPVWDYWPLLLIPLTVGVAVAYKTVKCASMAHVPREAAVLTLWILGGMTLAAIVLSTVVRWAR